MHDAISNPTSINGEGNWRNPLVEGSQLSIISAQMIDGEAQTLNDSSNMIHLFSGTNIVGNYLPFGKQKWFAE